MIGLFTEIWHLVVLSTLWCVGFYMISREPGDALYFVTTITEKWPTVLKKPIAHCINCMASIHTAFIMFLYYWFWNYTPTFKEIFIEWLIVAVITAGTNGIVWNLYKYYDLINAYNEQHESNDSDTIK